MKRIEKLGEKAFNKLKECYDSEVIYKQWEALFSKLKKSAMPTEKLKNQ